MPVRTLLCQHDHTDDTARASIPLDSFLQSALDEVDRIFLLHTLLPVGIAVTVNVCRTRTADGICLLVQRASQGDRVDLAAMSLVPASDDESSAACTRVVSMMSLVCRDRDRDQIFNLQGPRCIIKKSQSQHTSVGPCSSSKAPGRWQRPFVLSGSCRYASQTCRADIEQCRPQPAYQPPNQIDSTRWYRELVSACPSLGSQCRPRSWFSSQHLRRRHH
jgi:hypothetical protein